MIKTNEKIIHLINGLMAADCVDDEKQKKYIELSLTVMQSKPTIK